MHLAMFTIPFSVSWSLFRVRPRRPRDNPRRHPWAGSAGVDHICLLPGVPHLPPPFRSGQGDLNTSLMKGLTATRSRLPPNGTKPDRSGLTARRRTGISASYCCVPRILLGPDIKDPRQAPANTLDEPLGGEKEGPGPSDWAQLGIYVVHTSYTSRSWSTQASLVPEQSDEHGIGRAASGLAGRIRGARGVGQSIKRRASARVLRSPMCMSA